MEAMKISSKDSFEIGFNTACGLLAAGEYVKAQSELEHAQRLGEHSFSGNSDGCICLHILKACSQGVKPSSRLVASRCCALAACWYGKRWVWGVLICISRRRAIRSEAFIQTCGQQAFVGSKPAEIQTERAAADRIPCLTGWVPCCRKGDAPG